MSIAAGSICKQTMAHLLARCSKVSKFTEALPSTQIPIKAEAMGRAQIHIYSRSVEDRSWTSAAAVCAPGAERAHALPSAIQTCITVAPHAVWALVFAAQTPVVILADAAIAGIPEAGLRIAEAGAGTIPSAGVVADTIQAAAVVGTPRALMLASLTPETRVAGAEPTAVGAVVTHPIGGAGGGIGCASRAGNAAVVRCVVGFTGTEAEPEGAVVALPMA